MAASAGKSKSWSPQRTRVLNVSANPGTFQDSVLGFPPLELYDASG